MWCWQLPVGPSWECALAGHEIFFWDASAGCVRVCDLDGSMLRSWKLRTDDLVRGIAVRDGEVSVLFFSRVEVYRADGHFLRDLRHFDTGDLRFLHPRF